MKAKALKEKAKSAKPITAMTVYPPNTPAKLKNILIENENLIVACLSKDVFYTAIDSVLTVSRFSDMHNAYTAAQKRIAELEAENSNLTQKIQKDDHDEMIKHFSKLEVEHLNLQLKYQHLKERFGNKKSVTSSDAPAFESVFEIGHLKEHLQGRGNTIRELKAKISRLQKKHSEADPILNFKALDSQNKYLNAKANALQDLNERFKAQIKGKTKCVTMPDPGKPKVLAPGMYVIDVEPISPRNRNNREVHLEYLKHLKESVGTLHEIVEEVRVEKPLHSSLASACLYTKHSQELLEYVIGTCLKDFNKRDRKIATTPLNRKKRVTFVEPGETSTNNSQTHVEQQTPKKTNEPMIPSTGVKDATTASGSKPRKNIKKDRTFPSKSDKKKVKDHSRNNKSSVKQKNCVDSSISYKRTVINSNSNSVSKTCNKILMSFNHDKCVVKSLKFVKKVRRVKPVKQVWQATGTLFTSIEFQWQPTGMKFTLGEQCPLTRFTESKVVLVKQPKRVSTSDIVITKRLSNTSPKPLTRYQRKNKQEKEISTDTPTTTVTQLIDDYVKLSVVHIVLWYLDSGCSKHMTGDRSRLRNFVKKFIGTVRFGNDHFGAIMGYGDYVIGDSVISRVYYVEGLGHNLFSVVQFCNSDLEVAFRKHSCYV
ncbi:hypothetical protein Tco_0426066 [Tanacetum coccineum]